jgi:hypothetical protein
MTKDQMTPNSICCIDQVVTRTDVLESPKSINAKTKERYILLKTNVLIGLEIKESIK